MIHSITIEKIRPHLGTIGPLMDRYQRGEPNFPDEVVKWLSDVEKALSSARVPDGSELAVLRGRIVKAADALNTGEEGPARSRVRSARNVAAADSLERAEDILRSRMNSSEERLKKFEDKLCEGMTALMLQVELPPRSGDLQHWLQQIWQIMKMQDATRPLSIYLAASLNSVDRLYILEAVVGRLMS